MEQTQITEKCSKLVSYDAYFEMIQRKKKLPHKLQESLTAAFAKITVSSFLQVPGGRDADTLIGDAVRILSESNIPSAPVRDPAVEDSNEWRERYLGILDYSAIVVWVLESAEIEAKASSANSAALAGTGVCVAGAHGALAMSATSMADPAVAAGLTVAAVGAAVAGGVAAETGIGNDAPTAADKLGMDFYKVILEEEPFKSTTVRSIVESYCWAPFVPVATDSSMLTVLLLLSKYRLRSVPAIETGKPFLKNLITQSAVIKGLEECKGRDWFNSICSHPISDLGLPYMSSNEVVSIQSDELILEAFEKMRDNDIGGLPVVQGPAKKIVGDVSIGDIRFLLLNPELFSNFRKLTVKDFIITVGSETHEPSKVATAITCKLDSTLGNVIEILASKSVHRIYVTTDEDNEVVGVITLRDVISCFIFEPPHFFDNYFGFSAQEMFGG
ncbi:SNF1-related protein kinase regulatory subunit gamma-1-like isoform X2 [Lycium ferocissimum]|uniref:SNF1-related protein kinase regulatory subunit gamma-1-like isoform X2 n=1 Tax=Lycium ferocissimum TaxID=112874 RepID=UPI002814B046|nr:SNF1-related protein kinase regulatory subunit gamma-1-like isoform X2 [Lycium ferocissimum]